MSGRSREPERLREGKAFHKKVQADWVAEAEGDVRTEMTVRKEGGRGGRLDVFVSQEGSEVRGIVEIKHSDWDKMTPQAVRRNVRRQARQIWRYVESQSTLDGICPGIIFPKRPSDRERLELIEELFGEEAISVVWEDESAAEVKARSKAARDGVRA
ncbi:MAG: hypothetical protein JXQ73_29590 [Phycisphaerae bacterium]|nr:hypothetical protein [Phycisphaerae bacterium]